MVLRTWATGRVLEAAADRLALSDEDLDLAVRQLRATPKGRRTLMGDRRDYRRLRNHMQVIAEVFDAADRRLEAAEARALERPP